MQVVILIFFEYSKGAMKKDPTKRTWYRLDNAAIMIPATTGGSSTRVFRIVCELKEDICRETLQKALNRTIWEFPHFNAVLRKGLFWYYLDEIGKMPSVTEDRLPACAPLYFPGRRTLLYRVSFFRTRINLEMFHVLADGTGAFVFFRRLIIHYLEMKYGITVSDMVEASSLEEKTDDAFRHFYEPPKFWKQLKTMRRSRAFHPAGEKDPDFRCHLLELRISAAEFIRLAHSRGVTAGVLATSMYIAALMHCMTLQDRRLPVVISVPVNLRQFFPSDTTRNFFGTVKISYSPSEYDGTLDSILPSVTAAFDEKIRQESLKNAMNSLAALEYNPMLRAVPLLLKDPVIGIFARESERGVSGTVSNLGRIRMPSETETYISRFAAFMSKPNSQLCICSYQDEMIFGYCDGQTDHSVMLQFVRQLTSCGIAVEITSNDCDRKENEPCSTAGNAM